MDKRGTIRLVKPYAKGQITIPADFREKLGIDENTILQLQIKGSKIEITPLRLTEDDRLIRDYDDRQIQAFLKEDKIDAETAEKVRALIGG